MNFPFWNQYEFLDSDLAIVLDKRLKIVSDRIENFFKNVVSTPLKEEYIEFYLAGSCLKRDTFRDIDLFFLTNEALHEVLDCIDKKYFLYKNNSHTFKFENDIFQCVYRERFLNKNLKFVIDIFDFYSTKIGFKCRVNTKNFKLEVVESEVRKEFVLYMKKRYNHVTRINQNPFVSLQRAIHFCKSGDDVPFHSFLDVILEIMKIDPVADYEKCFQRIQGDGQNYEAVKKAIEEFLEKRKELEKRE
ncbi:hypothetical protein [Halarcobacter ebronensis]|uniref:Nucleotidyltransferase n=1 Tax=Halarcobacter ebronensis TaxID=1462615 RepID=A0A4Q1AL55_9BACT|nr:hypothetical protein [Halarcobacter ebronensis]QKF83278.1 hypothetical protein AEBR_2827 [Halarcobacter ebronensis]RXK05841.1 hypothetical protein CRV07_07150 [Halarcobacter ebronensis]